jgi:hypothetical protein
MIYAWGQGGYDGPICRYTRDLKPAPLASTGKNTFGSLGGRMGRGNNSGGIAADLRGWVYAYHSVGNVWPAHVSAWDAEGKVVDVGRQLNWPGGGKNPDTKVSTLVGPVQDCGGCVRVDAAGNVYVGQLGYPKGYQPPKGYEKDDIYLASGGSVLKFGPKGGERMKAGGPDTVLGFTGVLQAYPGLSPMSGPRCGPGCCNCARPFFDVDGYGRLYVPDAYTFKVSVRDNSGNEIVRFGGYGNYDAQGPKSAEPKPEIPLGWPVFAQPSEKYIYVGDGLNHRVVRVDKAYAAEDTCEVR